MRNRILRTKSKLTSIIETDDSIEESERTLWTPAPLAAFKLLLCIRFASAFWSNISDCDEVYNYWEPLHYILYGKGFQTWEYSPRFALRSYLYILVHTPPVWFFVNFVQISTSPIFVFYFLRCVLATICASCEVYFYAGIHYKFGASVARLTLSILVLSTGMFISGTAFLPSTTSMYLCMLAHGAWFRRRYELAIFMTALSSLLSWPFAALLGLPIAFDLLVQHHQYKIFFKWSFISLVTIVPPMVTIDSLYYGRFVLAPFNIIKYNVFTDHGPDLYGTEPWYFYILNGFLNFNIAFVASVFVLLSAITCNSSGMSVWLRHAAFHLWLAVFCLQPHKEERFLFPVYPLIALAAASSIDNCLQMFRHCKDKRRIKFWTNQIVASFLVIFGLISVSRTFSLFVNYHGSIDIWIHLNRLKLSSLEVENSGRPTNICLGSEWYRFPSSFFLPDSSWHLEYIESDFGGQLPRPFGISTEINHDSSIFNDLNVKVLERFRITPNECDYVMGFNEELTAFKFRHSNWSNEISFPFLNATASTNRILRAFYVPFLSYTYNIFTDYALSRRRA